MGSSKKAQHKHHKCEHNIEFCAPCNEAYCLKCDLVFTSEPCNENHYPYWYSGCTCSTGTFTYDYPNVTTTITTGTIDYDSNSAIYVDNQNITLSDYHSSH